MPSDNWVQAEGLRFAGTTGANRLQDQRPLLMAAIAGDAAIDDVSNAGGWTDPSEATLLGRQPMAAFVVDAEAARQLTVAAGFSPAADARGRGRDALLAKLD